MFATSLFATLRRRLPGGGPAPALDDWRQFADRRHRVYHLLALSQGVVLVLAGFDVVIPFALEIGAPPAFAALLGALPVLGGFAQLLVPNMLARTDGNLRGLTMLAAGLSETRGLLYCLLAVLFGTGLLSGELTLMLLAVVVLLAGVVGTIMGANLLAWHSAVLPEEHRRLVVPRLMALSLGLGALLLFPMAVLLDVLAAQLGMIVYAIPFAISGFLGLVEVAIVARLPHPGRVIVPPRALDGYVTESPEQRQFLRVSTLNALGMGITPLAAIYAMSVLGLSAGFAMTLGAVSMLTMVLGATLAGAALARGSSSRMLRNSFAVRAVAVLLPIAALPGTAFAPLLLYASVALAAAGFSSGQLAANERLFRLIRGPAVIRQHGRYLARTSGAMTAGQVAAGGVLAVAGPLGYPAFALLYGISCGLRVLAHRQAAPTRLAERPRRAAEPVLALLEAGRSP
ncbi:MAG TPA: hypothetical protein VMP67_02055 [Candidatus Limnocylindria bacterium]|nr:hypothetical protein [Candidatus Limnocylindria bacterium]